MGGRRWKKIVLECKCEGEMADMWERFHAGYTIGWQA